MSWIDIKTAIAKTGKSDKALRNWIKLHKTNPNAVTKRGRLVMLSESFLKQDYPFIELEESRKDFQKQKEMAQLSITAGTIERRDQEIASKDKIIEDLISDRKKTPIYAGLFFLMFLFIILTGIGSLFYFYLVELKEKEQENIKQIQNSFKQQTDLREQISEEKINSLNQLNEIQNEKIEELKLQIQLIQRKYQILKSEASTTEASTKPTSMKH